MRIKKNGTDMNEVVHPHLPWYSFELEKAAVEASVFANMLM